MPQLHPLSTFRTATTTTTTSTNSEAREYPYDHNHHNQQGSAEEQDAVRLETHVVAAVEHRRALQIIREAVGISPRATQSTTRPQPLPPPHISTMTQSPRPRWVSAVSTPPPPPMPPNLNRRSRGVGLMIRDMTGSFRSLATDTQPRTVARQVPVERPIDEEQESGMRGVVVEQFARVMQTSAPYPDNNRMIRTWVMWDADEAVPPSLPPLDDEGKGTLKPREPLARAVCCVCLNDEYPCDIVFSGCGHMNTCLPCTQILVARAGTQGEAAHCPLCRVKSRPILVHVA